MNELERYLARLGLRIGATLDDVNRAYRALAWNWHPDRLPPDQRERGTQQLQEINEARAWLQRHGQLLVIARTLRLRSARCPYCAGQNSYRDHPLGRGWTCRECGASFRVVRGVARAAPEETGGRGRGWVSVGAVCGGVLLFGAWLGDGHRAFRGLARDVRSTLARQDARRSDLAEGVHRRRDRSAHTTASIERQGLNELNQGPNVLPASTNAHSSAAPLAGDAMPAAAGGMDRDVRPGADRHAMPDDGGVSAGSRSERQPTRSESWHAKPRNGAGGYDACVRRRLRALAPRAKRPPALTALSPPQRQAIEDACWKVTVKKTGGRIRRDLDQLAPQARRAELSALKPSERNAIEALCWSATVRNSTAAARACIKRQLDDLGKSRPPAQVAAWVHPGRRRVTAIESATTGTKPRAD